MHQESVKIIKNSLTLKTGINIIRVLHTHSPIAQLVEQMTVNHWVAGSSPARGAIFYIYQ